jgi:HEAT repeat protein
MIPVLTVFLFLPPVSAHEQVRDIASPFSPSLHLSISSSSPDDWSDFATLAKDPDPDKRCQAVDKIKKYKDLKMVTALLPLLADAHPRVRHRAMMAIKAVNDADGQNLIVEKGLKHADKNVRRHSVEALGWIKDKATIPAVLEKLSDSDADVRAQACDALAWMRAKEAADPLNELFDRRFNPIMYGPKPKTPRRVKQRRGWTCVKLVALRHRQ